MADSKLLSEIVVAASLSGVAVSGIIEFFKARFPNIPSWGHILSALAGSVVSVILELRYSSIELAFFDCVIYAVVAFGASQGFFFGAVKKASVSAAGDGEDAEAPVYGEFDDEDPEEEPCDEPEGDVPPEDEPEEDFPEEPAPDEGEPEEEAEACGSDGEGCGPEAEPCIEASADEETDGAGEED